MLQTKYATIPEERFIVNLHEEKLQLFIGGLMWPFIQNFGRMTWRTVEVLIPWPMV
jgi:hypothetical protein